ncbi:hypothetical protein Lesp02_18570 [Lentzea sp. NBRC 105346]|uniref:hypothetical protein n=1 Tax=Lentzea sp. NBRC 105346 TaxID=3032205 RepID=UPI0024A52243|nr:hypothetical protein [Lentzea sp. NBRC 105346]GLZ29667.1 hypothetical protein Lesp02_18570 [Lentzea sp. NBRC 105346]
MRKKHRAFVVLTVAGILAGCAVATLGQQARISVEAALADNARGAYDILVTPGAAMNLEQTHGVVEPNFLAATGAGGIDLATVERVRGLGDVELAAPVSIVGSLALPAQVPLLAGNATAVQPGLYDVSLTSGFADGVREWPATREQFKLAVTPQRKVLAVNDTMGADPVFNVVGTSVPALRLPVVAVDPVAEAALLGGGHDVLTRLAATRAAKGTWTAKEFSDAGQRILGSLSGPDRMNALGNLAKLKGTASASPATPVIPVVTVSNLPMRRYLRAEVTQLGGADSVTGLAEDERTALVQAASRAGGFATRRLPAEVSTDPVGVISSRPFYVDFPGQRIDPAKVGFSYRTQDDLQLRDVLSGRPDYRTLSTPGDGRPLEVGVTALPAEGDAEPRYRATESVPLAVNAPAMKAPAVEPFAIGDLPAESLRPAGADGVGSVPLGVYDVPPVRVLESEHAKPGTELLSTGNPAGLVSLPPAAIADVRDAVTLRGGKPVDAIRVRVGGITKYDTPAVSKVERVADRIMALGLHATIVLGSSPQEVRIRVAGYLPDGHGGRTDLGVVGQRWTTIGAAQRIEHGTSTTGLLLGGLAAVALLGVVLSLQVARGASLARDAAVLRLLGWRRSRAARWLAAPTLKAAAAGALVVAAGWWLSSAPATSLALGLTIALAAPLALVAGLWRASGSSVVRTTRSGDVRRATWAGAVRGPASLAVRSVLSRPLRHAVLVALLVIGGVTFALGTDALLALGGRTGPTMLAGLVVDSVRPIYHLLVWGSLAAVVIGAHALNSFISTDTAAERRALRLCGWDAAALRSTRRRRRVLLAAPALLIAFVLTIALIGATAPAVTAVIAFTASSPLWLALSERTASA